VGASERRKGAEGEREVAAIFRDVMPDETLRLPLWTREAAELADPLGLVPIIAYRRSREAWRADLPLADLARYMAVYVLYNHEGVY
jgi:hypothetical protein